MLVFAGLLPPRYFVIDLLTILTLHRNEVKINKSSLKHTDGSTVIASVWIANQNISAKYHSML